MLHLLDRLGVFVLAQLRYAPMLQRARMEEVLIDRSQLIGELGVEVLDDFGSRNIQSVSDDFDGDDDGIAVDCPGWSIGALQGRVRALDVFAQHVADRLDAFAALGAASAGGVDLAWGGVAGAFHSLLQPAVGQRVAEANIHLANPGVLRDILISNANCSQQLVFSRLTIMPPGQRSQTIERVRSGTAPKRCVARVPRLNPPKAPFYEDETLG